MEERVIDPKDGVHGNFLTTLGLCARAGKLVYGVPMICEALGGKGITPVMVVKAADASENTKKRIMDKCAYYRVECVTLMTDCATLASAVGKSAPIAAVGILDPGFLYALKLK